MSPILIYGMGASAPFRIVTMTCEVLGLQYEIKPVNILEGENKKPEYLKLNPQHTIPTLVDGKIVINESRAAAAYLISKYGGDKKKQLYPEDPESRAVIDQRMYFDIGTFYKALGDCVFPILLGPAHQVEPDQLVRLREVLGWARDFVKSGFAAGSGHLTLADICFMSTYSTLLATEIVDLHEFNPELNNWFNKCKALIPNYEKANGIGAGQFGGWFKSTVDSKNN